MYNPLFMDPAGLKDSELENKILELSKKYSTAAQLGNGSLANQVLTLLLTLKDEQIKRSQTLVAKTIKNDNKDLGNLININ
jgi:hypothetical protein